MFALSFILEYSEFQESVPKPWQGGHILHRFQVIGLPVPRSAESVFNLLKRSGNFTYDQV
jgi:hypothetical protein